MAASRIKFIQKGEIERIADDFLKQHHSSMSLPIPIEDIAELSLGLRIIPIHNLKNDFGVDSYITSDFKQIVIDQYCYDKHENRCRFTYAHEMAHLILHKGFYSTGSVNDIKSFLKFQNSITNDEIKSIEIQAYYFAGYVLLLSRLFRKAFEDSISLLGGKNSVSIANFAEICQNLSSTFLVSEEVVFKQVKLVFPEIYELVTKLV